MISSRAVPAARTPSPKRTRKSLWTTVGLLSDCATRIVSHIFIKMVMNEHNLEFVPQHVKRKKIV